MSSLPQGPFPRVYRYTLFWRFVGVLIGGGILAWVPFMIHYSWTLPHSDLGGRLILTAFSLFGLFMAYCMIAAALRQRVILGNNSIEVVSLFGTRRIAYADIAAKVRLPANYPVWALVSAQDGGKPVKFDMGYGFDQSFKDWLAVIPERELKLFNRPRI